MPEAAAAVAAPVEAPVTEPSTPEPELQPNEPVSKKYKVKVDDQELEVDEKELLNGYGLRKASMKRFEDAARLQKESDAVQAKLKYLEENFDSIAEEFILKKYQKSQMTPEQAELENYREQEKQRKAQEAAAKEDAEKQQLEVKKTEIQKSLEGRFLGIIEKTGLPKTTDTVRRLALFYDIGYKSGIDLPDETLASEVEESYNREWKGHLASKAQKSGDALLDALGPELLKQIRKADIARIRRRQEVPAVKEEKPATEPGNLRGMDAFRKKYGMK